ncbi:hypothetical protein LJC33_06915 [Eubacteriales bacterium OttesenSCG-928-N13]|nr:hypothetical protein [Eubacteriales bacterium OttesenSCG-928-N13]
MTKQFGKLKLHLSKKGIAYKWGEGDIKRLAFPGQGSSANTDNAAYSAAGDGYDANQQAYYDAQDGGSYQDDRDYGASYHGNQNYDAEHDGYYSEGGQSSGRYEFLYQHDWLMWVLLVVLPPAGIWILWKRQRFEPTIRAAISAASAIWFLLMLIWLFTRLFSGGGAVDPTTAGVQGGVVPNLTATNAPTDNQTSALPTLSPDGGDNTVNNETNEPVNNDPVGGSTGNTGTTGNTNNTEEPTTTQDVWATSQGAYYHKDQNCSRISGTPQKITLAVAKTQGKTACDVCYTGTSTTTSNSGSSVYATSSGKWYHKASSCSGSGLKNGAKVTLSKAKKDGKTPCPYCIGVYYMTKNGKYYHSKASCSGMSGAKRVTMSQVKSSKKPACPVCIKKSSSSSSTKKYYSKAGGTYYHTKANCSGMTGASKVTMAVITARKQKPCPTCVKTSSSKTTTYYATTSGKYYHVKKTCSGMKNATKITLTSAKKKGKTACPTCIPKKAASTAAAAAAKINNTYVYMNKGGSYYHSKANCNDMKTAPRITLANAKKAGGKACPICMKTTYYYATASNKYYHVKANCMNIKNATKMTLVSAKAKGKTACPVCITKKAKASDFKLNTYVVSGGRYYHKNKTCQGMKNAKKVTLASAKISGKTACPVCVLKKSSSNSNQSADSKVACYVIKKGTYFHTTKSCPKLVGRSGIHKTTVAKAKNNEYRACPDCVGKNTKTYVYVMPAGLLYHRTASCSGMKNPTKLTLSTAINRAYKRCTKCNAPASK